MKANAMINTLTKIFTLSVFLLASFSSVHAQAMPNISPEIMNYAMIPLIFLIMYFLVIRPQSKKAKLHQQMLTALRRGDQVLTAGGIIGMVHKIENDQEIQVDIAEGVRVRIAKGTIVQVLAKTEPLKTTTIDVDTDISTDFEEVNSKPSKVMSRTASKVPTQSRKRTPKSK
ncbi:MAG: preprotein translocase subunit YajC [Janthinobacterium lividum]